MNLRRIPNDKLKRTDVPAPTAPWPEIELFALTLEGYEEIPNGGCADLANNVSDAFSKDAKSLEGLTLTELRACLFFEQRRHHFGWGPEGNELIYIGALLDSIRSRF